MLSMLTDDVAHDLNQGAREVGREAFRAFLQRMDRCYGEQLRGIVVMVSADGLRRRGVRVHGEYKVTDDGLPEAQGQRYVLPGGAFFEIRDGKIARVTNYYNLGDWIAQVGGTPEMTSDVQVLVHRGPDIAEWFDAVAGLRASVFRSFLTCTRATPYEKHYLAMYARSADSLLVLALADDVVVGASTGLPLGDAEPAFRCRSPIEESRWRQCFTAANQSCFRPSGALAWAIASLTNAKRMPVRWAACSGHRSRRWIEQTTIPGVLPTTAVMIPLDPSWLRAAVGHEGYAALETGG
jgi:steroid delta-isomerase-like uncharacterized protein